MNDLEAEIAALKDRVDAMDKIIDRMLGVHSESVKALMKLQDMVFKILEIDRSKS